MKKGIIVAVSAFMTMLILSGTQGDVQAGAKKTVVATPTPPRRELVYDEVNLEKNPWQGAYDQWKRDNAIDCQHPNWIEDFWTNVVGRRISGNFEYYVVSETGKEAVVTKILHPKNKVVIPQYIEGYKIVGIGQDSFLEEDVMGKENGKYYQSQTNSSVVDIDDKEWTKDPIEIIVLPKGIKYIGNEAFAGCSSLKEINLEAVQKRIDKAAFKNCNSLKQIIIAENVIIENEAFEECSRLESIVISSGVLTRSDCFKGCGKINSVICNSDNVYFPAFGTSDEGNSEIKNLYLNPTQKQAFTLRKILHWKADKICVGKNVPFIYLNDGIGRWTGELWDSGIGGLVVRNRLIVQGKQTERKKWDSSTGMKKVILSTVPKAKSISWAKKLHVTYQTTAVTKQAKKVTKKGKKVTWKKAAATIKKYTYGKNKKWKKTTKKGKVIYRIYGKKTKSAKYTYVKQTKKTQAQVPYKYVKVKAEAVIE